MTHSARAALVCAGSILAAGVALGVAQTRRPGVDVSGPWRTEQEWIVADVAVSILRMAASAEGSRSVDPASIRVQVRAADAAPDTLLAHFDVESSRGERFIVAVKDHIWAPDGFAPLARRVIAAPSMPCPAEFDSTLVRALLEPTADVIQRENLRISERLATRLGCRAGHDEAALLLGSFALREAASVFSDTRRVMSRMAAHMAVARVAAGPTDEDMVRISEALLMTLAGRQRTALEQLSALQSRSTRDEVQAWIRALRLRNTMDWRSPNAPAATLLEQLSQMRARAVSLGFHGTLPFFETIAKPADVLDWGRLMMHDGASIEASTRFGARSMTDELNEAAKIRRSFDPQIVLDDISAVVDQLNVEPSEGPVLPGGAFRVIDWGTWAAAAQRHLLIAVNSYDTHLGTVIGDQERASFFRQEVERHFSRLRLYPFAAVLMATSADQRRSALTSATDLVRARPDLASDWLWKCLQLKAAAWKLDIPVPSGGPWFAPYVLPGTAFDIEHRPFAAGNNSRLPPARIEALREVAPNSRSLIWESVRTRNPPPGFNDLLKEYGELGQYDLRFARDLAESVRGEPDRYIERMQHAATLDPSAYFRLGAYLADRGNMAGARAAFEKGLATERSEVAVSNSAWWLVRHYFERREHRLATDLANRAADTYSYWGLITRADLHAWRGEHVEAERVLRAAYERYDDADDLAAFYLRQGRTGPDAERVIAEIFPDGVSRVVLDDFNGAPRSGIVITTTGVTGAAQGLRPGDVVVAVEGIRVQNVSQYRAARGSSARETIQFVVWREGAYRQVSARLRYNWPVSSIDDYDPTRPAVPQ